MQRGGSLKARLPELHPVQRKQSEITQESALQELETTSEGLTESLTVAGSTGLSGAGGLL